MKSCMVLRRGLVASLMFLLLSGIQSVSAQGKLHLLKFDDVTQLRDFFKYTGNGSIIVSGHRGGYEENVLKQMPAFFEIDPRLTKDSVIVLMHDATLDRTTTGTGKVCDHTWKELQKLRLKDHSGKVTNCKIPTLESNGAEVKRLSTWIRKMCRWL